MEIEAGISKRVEKGMAEGVGGSRRAAVRAVL